MITDLKKYKQKYKLSNKQLADLFEISMKHLSQIMNNRQRPSTTLIDRIISKTNYEITYKSFFDKKYKEESK